MCRCLYSLEPTKRHLSGRHSPSRLESRPPSTVNRIGEPSSSRDSLSGEWTRSTRVNWSLASKSSVADQIFRICDYVAHRGLVNVVLQVGAAFFTSSSNCGGT